MKHLFTKGMDMSHFKRNQRGDNNNSRKLSEDKVREIRRHLANGEKQYWIAIIYGVDRSVISSIHTKKTWGHVDG